LWDEALPIEVRELPADLCALDELLSDLGLVAPFSAHWQSEALVSGVSAAAHGRPTIAIETYVRLMALKQRYSWGYRTLVAEVSDSIHLRRFCRIALTDLVPDESTLRKLTRRVGPETVNEIIQSADRLGGPRAALLCPGAQDRLDGDRGRHAAAGANGVFVLPRHRKCLNGHPAPADSVQGAIATAPSP